VPPDVQLVDIEHGGEERREAEMKSENWEDTGRVDRDQLERLLEHELHKRGMTRLELVKGGMALATTVGLASLFAACGGDDDSAATTQGATEAGAPAEPAEKPAELLIRNWGDPWRSWWRDNAGKRFTEDTGIPIRWDTTDTAVLLTRFRQDEDQRPPVDAIYGESVQTYIAISQGLTVPLNPEIATVFNTMTPSVAQPGSGLPDYSAMGMYTFSAPLMYLKDKVPDAEESLSSWLGLWDPQFENAVMVGGGYQSFSFTMSHVLGADPLTEMDIVGDKLEELRPNLYAVGGDTEIVNGLISGDCWVTQAIPGDGIAAEDEGASVGYIVPKEGNYVDRDMYFVLKNLPPEVEYYATLFANYIGEPDVQTAMADTLGVIPGQPEATLPTYMAELPAVYPATEEEIQSCATIPLQAAAENADDYQAAYDRALTG
jgi:spermidine/putrescine-binding protein